MNPPTFSIIIPALNEEKHLPACLQSIQNLDYPKDRYEVILVDNGSTDLTAAIAAGFGARLLQDASRTVGGLRNLGARDARGRILAFVDADCSVSRHWLKAAAKYENEVAICAWGAAAIPPRDATWVQEAWFAVRKKPRPIQEVDWLESMNLFIRTQAFEEAGGFDENLATCEDVDLCYRLARFGRIVSDSDLEVVHHGEAATIREFVRKELWRGRSNLKGAFRHGLSLKEVPSLILPLYFVFFLPLVAVAFVLFGGNAWSIAGLSVLFFLPTLAVLIKARHNISRPGVVPKLALLLQVYFLARSAAAFKRPARSGS